MPGLVPNASEVKILDELVAAYLSGCTLRLYSNNHTPDPTDTVADYTECTFPGYAGKLMNLWSAAALNPSFKAQTEEPIQTWTAGVVVTPEDVYGIFVTDAVGDLVYAEENPAGVVSISVSGQQYSYTPIFTNSSE